MRGQPIKAWRNYLLLPAKARMMSDTHENASKEKERRQHRVRLPGFLVEQEVGLGDLIQRALHGFGIRSCGACQERAAALNRWMIVTRTNGSSR
jgi:hypothetical protein